MIFASSTFLYVASAVFIFTNCDPKCWADSSFRYQHERQTSGANNMTAVERTQLFLDAIMYNRSYSGVVQVTVDGETQFQQAMGFVNEEHHVPMTMEAVFLIGSNDKLFTAAALYRLQEQGKVNLSQAINDDLTQEDFAKFGFANQTSWCPLMQDMPEGPCMNITYVQLLSMSSGINENDCRGSLRSYSFGAHVGCFINDPLLFMPGTNYEYSTSAFILAQYMIEKFSGMKYGDYLKRNIFEPLGLQHTYFDPYDGQLSIIKNYAYQYWRFFANGTGEELGVGAVRFPIRGPGDLSIIASVDDLITWYLDLFSNHGTTSKVLSENSIRQIIKPWTLVEPSLDTFYGQGVVVTYPNGANSSDWPAHIQHNGFNFCAHSALFMQILSFESSTVIAALDNNCIMVLDSKKSYEDLRQMNVSFDSLVELFYPLPDYIPDIIVIELAKIWTSV